MKNFIVSSNQLHYPLPHHHHYYNHQNHSNILLTLKTTQNLHVKGVNRWLVGAKQTQVGNLDCIASCEITKHLIHRDGDNIGGKVWERWKVDDVKFQVKLTCVFLFSQRFSLKNSLCVCATIKGKDTESPSRTVWQRILDHSENEKEQDKLILCYTQTKAKHRVRNVGTHELYRWENHISAPSVSDDWKPL